MKTALLVALALLALPLAAPVAAADPATFGSCRVVYTTVWIVDGDGNGYGVDVPRGLECAW